MKRKKPNRKNHPSRSTALAPAQARRNSWREWYESKKLVLRFSVIFGLLLVLFYSLTTGSTYDKILAEYLNDSARLSSQVLNGFGVPSFVSGLTIESSRFAFTVQRGCDALEPSWFYLSAILAFPARFSRKLLGILVGIVLLNLLNLIRIASLFVIGSNWPGLFNTIHVEVWPAVFIIFSILLWFGWMTWTEQDHVAA